MNLWAGMNKQNQINKNQPNNKTFTPAEKVEVFFLTKKRFPLKIL